MDIDAFDRLNKPPKKIIDGKIDEYIG